MRPFLVVNGNLEHALFCIGLVPASACDTASLFYVSVSVPLVRTDNLNFSQKFNKLSKKRLLVI